MNIAIGLASILLLTLATAYFVAQEFAYITVDRGRLLQLAEQGDAAAARALRVTSRLSFTLSGAQLGITVTALLVGYVSEPYLGKGLAELLTGTTGPPESLSLSLSVAVAVALALSTVVQMVIGELTPKNYAIARPVVLARLLPHGATPEDLRHIIDQSHAGGLLDEDLSHLLDRGLLFRHLPADQVMTPRVDMVSVPATASVADVVELLGSGHSRFPVAGESVDDIVGVVGTREVLRSTRPIAVAVACPR